MTAQGLRELAKELVEEEITGNRFSEQYKNAIRKSLKDFLSWCVKRSAGDVREITKRDLVLYHKKLEQTKSKRNGELLSASTVNTRFYAVILAFNLLYQTGVIPENPVQGLDLKLPDNNFWKRRPLTVDEMNDFLEKIRTDTKQGLKDRTMFELMYSSGLRVCEVANLLIGDIDFDSREMIVRGKFGTDRVVPISIVAKDFLAVYLADRIDNLEEPVFIGCAGCHAGQKMKPPSISERFRDLLRRFDMDKKEISAHSIRHSTATHLLDNGASVRHVQELLGHKEITTTVRYTHVQTDGVARMYRKYHPREHDLFEAVDEAYIRHLENLVAGKSL